MPYGNPLYSQQAGVFGYGQKKRYGNVAEMLGIQASYLPSLYAAKAQEKQYSQTFELEREKLAKQMEWSNKELAAMKEMSGLELGQSKELAEKRMGLETELAQYTRSYQENMANQERALQKQQATQGMLMQGLQTAGTGVMAAGALGWSPFASGAAGLTGATGVAATQAGTTGGVGLGAVEGAGPGAVGATGGAAGLGAYAGGAGVGYGVGSLTGQALGGGTKGAAGGALTGAGAGALYGTYAFPGIGTGIGAVIGAITGAIGGGGKCCFIFIASHGYLHPIVRNYRDKKMTKQNRRGYYWLADRLVPLMEKSKIATWIVKWAMVKPMTCYGKYYYNLGRLGALYAPITAIWRGIFNLLGHRPPYQRQGTEEVV